MTLRWKQATSAPEIIPAAVAYPGSVVGSFAATAALYHRAAKFIDGFRLDERELGHFKAQSTDFDGIGFKALQPQHWRRIHRYTTLRAAVPQSQATLVDVFAEAVKTDPASLLEALFERLYLATGWDQGMLSFFSSLFQLAPTDFRNELALLRLERAVRLARSTGIPVTVLADWAKGESNFEGLGWTAQAVKNAVKAKYEEEDWLTLAGSLSDTLRKHQQAALISYLLVRPELQQQWGVTDADSLFEYFLIDVQMGACMDTSRIVQANASVQLFVSRCQINLESVRNEAAQELGVSPSYLDPDRWEWMKNYRVWEANRKVFLYPENWLEPEWRDDRSVFFKEFESELTQNDITARSVETAFRNYLGKLNEVANLELCGLYEEKDEKGYFNKLHLVGRTHNAPYKYFYRTWNKHQKWSAWEPIQADIRSVEDGENSGVHVIPVVWKKRLFIFWPEFQKVPQQASGLQKQTGNDVLNNNIGELTPDESWEIRLSWTEYVDGKWTPKEVTKETISSNHNVLGHLFRQGRYTFITYSPSSLTFLLAGQYFPSFSDQQRDSDFGVGYFAFSDIRANVIIGELSHFDDPSSYSYHFMQRRRKSGLVFNGDSYLNQSTVHHLLFSNHLTNLAFWSKPEHPFFYFDSQRTYFARPRTILVSDQIKSPELNLPGIVDDSWWTGPQGPILEDPLGDGLFADGGPITPFSGSATPVKASSQGSSQQSLMSGAQVLPSAFGGTGSLLDTLGLHPKKILEFHTFHHPYSSQFVSNLNREGKEGGIKGLLE
ncbi:MAG: hypothetical protein L0312_15265, partial [Acidobacteria bacterium]|nr:hypothetical protein [Acidobacteriota bacterium]